MNIEKSVQVKEVLRRKRRISEEIPDIYEVLYSSYSWKVRCENNQTPAKWKVIFRKYKTKDDTSQWFRAHTLETHNA